MAGFNLLRPEAVVVVVAAEAWYTDADAVLRPADDAVAALGVVLKAEHQFGKHFRVHVGKVIGPYLLDHVAGGGGEAATFPDFKSGFQTDGDGPSGGEAGNVGLVDPCSC